MFSWLFRADGGDDRSVFGDFWFEPVSRIGIAGQRVSVDTAMRLSAVYRCVRVLADTMASLPVCFYRPQRKGRELVKNHWLWRLLAKRPNRWQNGREWHAMMMCHLTLRGTAYNRIIPTANGEIAELQPLNPDRMTIEALSSGSYRYKYARPDGSTEILPSAGVFKICGLSSNGFTGLSVIEHGAQSIGEGLAQQDYSARFFANDARPTGGWLEYPGTFKDVEAKKAWIASYQAGQGGVNRGKIAVLDGGVKYHDPTAVSNKDAQFLEAKNAKVPDICRWTGVPPHLAFALDRATDNNIEQLSLEFIKYTMRAWAGIFEAAEEGQLLDEGEEIQIAYDMDDLARGDMKSRAEYYQLGINGGWLTRNEARAKEGLNPLDELDEPLQPLNMVPAGTEPAPKPAPNQPAPADDTSGDDNEARARALELAIAGRVVRKETAALRKAYAKHAGDTWLAYVHDFYVEHADYVKASLLCNDQAAAAWCERQRDELLACSASQQPGHIDQVILLLEAWEVSAAAELAARIQMSAQRETA